ncbi:hypothetical protein [Streptomyces sp. NPDC059134]|uniref:hypothetical protein n=1 Tax=Streptomyces sp. NPDC059134 TaxID=3346738 RepID=UPI0036B12ECB
MVDETFWGVVALSISLIALVFGVLYATHGRPGAEEGAPDPPFVAEGGAPDPPFVAAKETYSYTCHCHREPVHITIRARQVPRMVGRGRRLP